MRFDARKKYPWSEWQNGSEHTVAEADYGKDYRTIMSSLYQRARRTGTYVQVAPTHGATTTITFRFFSSVDEYNLERTSHTQRDLQSGKFEPEPNLSHLPTCAICGALVRPEWPNGVCYVKGEGAGQIVSPSGLTLVPKH